MIRGYDVSFAKKYGLESAIIFNDLQCKQSYVFEENFSDGRYWIMFNQYDYEELSPVLIKGAMKTLEENGFIVVRKGSISGHEVPYVSVVDQHW